MFGTDGAHPSEGDRGRVTRRRDRLCRSGAFVEDGSPVFLLGVGVVDRARAEEDVWDGRSPSLRGRSWARYATEGPALSVWGFPRAGADLGDIGFCLDALEISTLDQKTPLL
jgi:hypothetical protein